MVLGRAIIFSWFVSDRFLHFRISMVIFYPLTSTVFSCGDR